MNDFKETDTGSIIFKNDTFRPDSCERHRKEPLRLRLQTKKSADEFKVELSFEKKLRAKLSFPSMV